MSAVIVRIATAPALFIAVLGALRLIGAIS